MHKTFTTLFVSTLFLILFSPVSANAQAMKTWNSEQVMTTDDGYPTTIGPADGWNYAELDSTGPVVTSSMSRPANSPHTGTSITSMQITFKVVWTLSGNGHTPPWHVADQATATADVSQGASLLDPSGVGGDGADAGVSGITSVYAETFAKTAPGNAAPYHAGKSSAIVREDVSDVTVDGQTTCKTQIHTVASTSTKGTSFQAQGMFRWHTTN